MHNCSKTNLIYSLVMTTKYTYFKRLYFEAMATNLWLQIGPDEHIKSAAFAFWSVIIDVE